jgi:hypothetical protein
MEVRLSNEVTLKEAEEAILAFGSRTTIHLVGEPGIGKTAMFKNIVAKTGYKGVFIDTPNTELGDIGIPMPDHETRTTTLYPNKHWGFHKKEPMVIFIDEFTKPSSMAVQNMLHPLTNERRIGGDELHEDSIVITTGNNTTDGVGDMLKAHSINRLTIYPIAKPQAGFNADGSCDEDSWGYWAMANDVAPEIIAWVKAFPHALASYKDASQVDNPYIFNPKTPQKSFVSPRSLARASHVVSNRHRITRNTLIAGLAGTIGESAARDMVAYVEIADTLPTWGEIMQDPKDCKLPTSPAALNIMAFGAIQKIDRNNISKWFEYLKRTPKELQSVFCLSTSKNEAKKQILFTSGSFVTWMRENQYLF